MTLLAFYCYCEALPAQKIAQAVFDVKIYYLLYIISYGRGQFKNKFFKQIVSHRIFTQDLYLEKCFALFSNLTGKIKTPTGLHVRIAQEIVYNLEICERIKGRLYDITNSEGGLLLNQQCKFPKGSFSLHRIKQEHVRAFRVETSFCFEPLNIF